MERKIYFEKYDLFIKYTENDSNILEYFGYLFIYLFFLMNEKIIYFENMIKY